MISSIFVLVYHNLQTFELCRYLVRISNINLHFLMYLQEPMEVQTSPGSVCGNGGGIISVDTKRLSSGNGGCCSPRKSCLLDGIKGFLDHRRYHRARSGSANQGDLLQKMKLKKSTVSRYSCFISADEVLTCKYHS